MKSKFIKKIFFFNTSFFIFFGLLFLFFPSLDIYFSNFFFIENQFISEKFRPIPRSIISPIIHCNENAPININKLKDVKAFPALDNEKAIPTAG